MRHYHAARIGPLICVIAVLIALHASTGLGQAASFHGLGFLFEGPKASSIAQAISADGTTVVGHGRSSGSAFVAEAFSWTAAIGIEPLGFLFPSNPGSRAWDVSADGSVVVGSALQQGSSLSVAFRWSKATGFQSLGVLPIPGNTGFSYGNAVSADGSVIVGESRTLTGNQAFRWTEATGIEGLGNLPGVTAAGTGGASGISADGSVIVGTATNISSSSTNHAFRWTAAEGIQDLGVLPGGETGSSGATAISGDGKVIVGRSWSATGMHGFSWTASQGMQILGDIPGFPGFYFAPQGITEDGSLVVGYIGTSGTDSVALIWDQLNGTRKLQDVLTNDYSLNLSGWKLNLAWDVSSNGRVITGQGVNPAGKIEAWVAIIPEPSGLVLAGMALVGLATVAIRRRRGRTNGDATNPVRHAV